VQILDAERGENVGAWSRKEVHGAVAMVSPHQQLQQRNDSQSGASSVATLPPHKRGTAGGGGGAWTGSSGMASPATSPATDPSSLPVSDSQQLPAAPERSDRTVLMLEEGTPLAREETERQGSQVLNNSTGSRGSSDPVKVRVCMCVHVCICVYMCMCVYVWGVVPT
jgi:hypothetical protein